MVLSLALAKRISISLGLYRPARSVHTFLFHKKSYDAYRKIFSEFVGQGDLVFDVGANTGDVTDCMLSIGAKVVAFEPQPACAMELRLRGANLRVVEKAVGSAIGFAEMYLKSEKTHASLVYGYHSGPDLGKIHVPVTTLDAAITEYGRPIFCKIDVEGFETEVLKGLSIPINLNFEYHTHERGVEQVRECIEILCCLGNPQFNLIGEATGNWLLSEWKSPAEFVRQFPACSGPYTWGDVFVRY
jgi:FkbM family methyltransferase